MAKHPSKSRTTAPSQGAAPPLWNWQKPDWPEFTHEPSLFVKAEALFQREGGAVVGSIKHLSPEERDQITVEILRDEAMTTSEIEGEFLDRESVQSSLRFQLGLGTDKRRIGPAEQGIAELTVDVLRTWNAALDDETLFRWHRMVTNGRRDLKDIGAYRTHKDAMQVVSGAIYQRKVHFEAPPSAQVPKEMKRFVTWFNRTAPNGKSPLPPVTRAGIAHLYFVCIHPFEDGNGRVGRAIAEKALSQGLSQPSLTSLSQTILSSRRGYYDALEAANKSNAITPWLKWFAVTVIDAQRTTQAKVDYVLEKTKLLDRIKDKLNARQSKVMLRMLREGVDGFEGGLSAEKYRAITGDGSPATLRRDLAELVEMGALIRTGTKKSTRYHIAIFAEPSRDRRENPFDAE